MNTSTGLAKCSCAHCGGHLEFDTAYAGAQIACPHCAKETVLYIPGQTPPPPVPSPAVAQAAPVAHSGYMLGGKSTPPGCPTSPLVAGRLPAPRGETFAPQAARASWIIFFVVLGLSCLLGGAGEQMKPVLLTAIPLLMLIGVALGVIALFAIRTHGIRGILIPALIGIFLNAGFLGALHRVRQIAVRKEVCRKADLAIADALRQADQGMITNLLPTGDAHIDASFRVWAELLNNVYVLRKSTASELNTLGEQQNLCSLGSSAAIKSEMDKRVAARKLIEKHQQEFSAVYDSARQKMRALKLPKKMEQRDLKNLTPGPNTDKGYSVRLQVEQAQFELLQFLWSEFGRYRVANQQVLFTSELKLQEFNRLTGSLEKAVREAQEVVRWQKSERQAVKTQLGQIARKANLEESP